MKISKQHVQISVLVVGALAVIAVWVAPMLIKDDAEIPAITAVKPTVSAPIIKVKPKPALVQTTIKLDKGAKEVIAKSHELFLANMQSSIERAKSETRRSQQEGVSERSGSYVPPITILDVGNTNTSSPKTLASHPVKPIDQFTLSGLFVSAAERTAYLTFSGGQAFQVKEGNVYHGVKVKTISEAGVMLSMGKKTRFLKGGL